jgi:hypothetical protein
MFEQAVKRCWKKKTQGPEISPCVQFVFDDVFRNSGKVKPMLDSGRRFDLGYR